MTLSFWFSWGRGSEPSLGSPSPHAMQRGEARELVRAGQGGACHSLPPSGWRWAAQLSPEYFPFFLLKT